MKLKLLSAFFLTLITFLSYGQIANQPNDLVVCDDDNDGFSQFDLTFLDAEVLGSQSSVDYTVTYHETQSDAVNGVGAIVSVYANIIQYLQTIYIRLEDNSTGNADTTTVDLIVNDTPIPVPPTSLGVCDNNYDGIESFDLSVKDVEITTGNASWSVAYYETNADAQAQNNAIPNPTQYTNTSVNGLPANPQTLYVAVTDTNTGCVGFTTLTIRVLPIPTPTPSDQIPDLVACDEFNTGDGVEVFDLIENELLIMNGEAGQTITYHISESDAFSASNSISDPTQFSNSFSPQTIYARVAIDVTGCFTVVDFDVEVIDCTDTDSDGVIDSDEDINENGNLDDDDTDNDGTPNYLDDDDDGDNVATNVEIGNTSGRANTLHPFIDTDNDTIENFLDDDDDGDGVLTIDEDYNNNGDPTDDDTNNNTVPDYLDNTVALSVDSLEVYNFTMHPNPANDKVIIMHNTSIDRFDVTLVDIQGKVINVTKTVYNDSVELNVSSLNSGLYFVQLRNGANNTIVKKLIIE